MSVCDGKKLFFCLWICLITVAAGTGLLAGRAIAAGGPETAPPGEGAPEAARQIRPKVGFVLQKVGGHWEPEREYYELFRLPGTHMRFGSFRYLIPEDEEMGAPMFGFLRDDGRFFYVRETAASDSDLHYALSGSYFVVDGGAGGSGVCRSMYLFKYDKDSMRLLDKIEEPDGGDFSPLGFGSDYPGKPAYGRELGTGHEDVPVWMISEKDRQRNPLIRLRMGRDLPLTMLGPEELEVFHIYLEIVNGRLRVALDPDLYVTIFNSLGDGGGPYSRSTEYYVSGFLAGKLSLSRIKAELVNNRERLWLLDSLRHVRRWDAELHQRNGAPFPKVREYRLNGR
jgi:hypothetical protein